MSTVKPPSARQRTDLESEGRRYTVAPCQARIEYGPGDSGGTSTATPAAHGDGHWIVYSATGQPLALLTHWDDDYSTQPVRPRTDTTASGPLRFGNALSTGRDWRQLVGQL